MDLPAQRPHFFDHTPESLGRLFADWGLPAFRARQVMQWVYAKGVAQPQRMTNLPTADRALLDERMTFLQGEVAADQIATDGTRKLLIDWALTPRSAGDSEAGPDARAVLSLDVLGGSSATQTECVMIPSDLDRSGRPRRTACISSQVGCPVGCKFCASGLGGLDANLATGQIVQQAWQLQQLPGVGRLSNVVFMGMGEPLVNLRHVIPALETLTAAWGMGISARRVTVSTVGVPAGIKKLAQLDLPVTLAISLHAPNDAIRQQIIPWASFVSIDQLLDAGRAYFDKTGREITLEYILLGGLNDRPAHARELARLAGKLRSNINLIRYNQVRGLPFDRPEDVDVLAFQAILKGAGVNTHIRASRGRDIAAACGQLRHEAAGV